MFTILLVACTKSSQVLEFTSTKSNVYSCIDPFQSIRCGSFASLLKFGYTLIISKL